MQKAFSLNVDPCVIQRLDWTFSGGKKEAASREKGDRMCLFGTAWRLVRESRVRRERFSLL